MKAIIHIGIEKTGTTALQSFLTNNRSSLNERGYAYLESAGLPSNRKLATYCIDSDRHDDHHEMLHIVESNSRKIWREQFLNDFHYEIDNLGSHVHTVIISNEQLHSRLIRETEIERVKQTLQDKFSEVEIVVYLRRQDQLATSLYSTALKCGHSFDSILPGVSDTDHYYNFEVLLTKWVNVFGQKNITVRLFDKSELVDGDLLSDFFSSSGLRDIDISKMVLPGRQNESLEPRAQEFLRVANRYIPMMVDGRFNQLRAHLNYQLENQFSGKPGLPLKKDAIAFCEKFKESNNRVAKIWFQRERLFSEDFSLYPVDTTEKQFSFEDAVIVATSILNGKMKSEDETTEQLLVDLQQSPQDMTRLIADHFLVTNPKLANYLRQNISSTSKVESTTKLALV